MSLTPFERAEVRQGIANGGAGLIVHAPTRAVLYSRPQTPEERRPNAAVSVLLIGAPRAYERLGASTCGRFRKLHESQLHRLLFSANSENLGACFLN